MRYAVILLLSALAVTLALRTPALADHDDVTGVGCGDIVDGAGTYDGSTVSFAIETAAASCPGITYTLNVVDISCPAPGSPCLDGDLAPVASQSRRGDRTTTLGFSVTGVASGGDSTVCLFFTSSSGRHVFDRAPDSGCMIRGVSGVYDCLVVCDSCSEIVSGVLAPSVGVPDTIRVPVTTATPSCPNVTYTIEVFDDGTLEGGPISPVLTSRSIQGNGATSLDLSVLAPAIPDTDYFIRVTTSGGGHVFDEGFGPIFVLEPCPPPPEPCVSPAIGFH